MANRAGTVLLTLSLALLLLAACQPVPVEPTVTNPPTATSVPTATIDWFPATETPTLSPTQVRTPTPAILPGLGELLFEDDFTSPEDWTVLQTRGKATIINQHVALVVEQTNGLAYAFRPEPILTDFYAEIQVEVKYCNPEDEYGLMVRVNGLRVNYYRLAVSCNGQARALRIFNDKATESATWITSPYIPIGYPSLSKLAVWAKGREIRFMINDQLLFTLEDTLLGDGALGVYARASGGGPQSVLFSDLVVYSLEE